MGQTTIEYVTILCVMVGLLITITLFVSPRLRDMVKNLVARIECALSLSGSGCGAPIGTSGALSGGSPSNASSPSIPPTSTNQLPSSSTLSSSASGTPGASSTASTIPHDHTFADNIRGRVMSGANSGSPNQTIPTSSPSSQPPAPPPPPNVSGNYSGSESNWGMSFQVQQASFAQNGNQISGWMDVVNNRGSIQRSFLNGTVNGSNVSFDITGVGAPGTNAPVQGVGSGRMSHFQGTFQPSGSLSGQVQDTHGIVGSFQLQRR